MHLRQITFDYLDSQTGEVTRGRIASDPAAVEDWVKQFCGREVHVAMEGVHGLVLRCPRRSAGWWGAASG